ncbi:MAG: tripartite tricarboxylate transporter substrate binding protein, partial [Pseudolabrys sp.]|nr:tripartite tricarboxylate transporter substrate binding protein [Pseudolabrys sp.]
AAPAVADVAGGNITMTFTSLGAVLPMMDAGKVRAVAVTSKERMPQLPEVPPLQEGAPSLAGYELLNFFALFGPAGLPQGQVNELNTIVNKAVEEPKTRETLLKQGIVPRPMNPEQFKAFVAAESKKFGDIITTASIKVEN